MPIRNEAYTLDNPFPLHSYAASLHWSSKSITSICYGDIVPVLSRSAFSEVSFLYFFRTYAVPIGWNTKVEGPFYR